MAPQWAALVFGSTHVPAQLTKPVGHVSEHVPDTHAEPAAQLLAQAPQ
jgi:hypothetical protein